MSFRGALEGPWTPEDEAVLKAPYNYLTKNPGKSLRSSLIKLFNKKMLVEEATLTQISAIIEKLHTASLLIDDIEDNSSLRRGRPTAHLIYGTPYTINSANYVYFEALQQVLELDRRFPGATEIFNEELMNLHRGQGLDLYWRETLTVPTEDEYLKMVVHKTGGLFRLSFKLMNLCGTVTHSREDVARLIEFTNLLGIIYQIKDDYLNLKSSVLEKNKGFCEDISEGKFSFPIIHSLQNGDKHLLMGLLRQRSQDLQVKQLALDLIEETKSFDYTKQVLAEFRRKTVEIINSIADSNGSNAAFIETVESFCVC